STAQARFGPPLRVTGVQHPAPELVCSLNRDAVSIGVSAPFARPVRDGKPLLLEQPNTQMWFLLYAQAAQIDGGGEKRNIFVGRKRGTVGEGGKTESTAIFPRGLTNAVLVSYGLKPSTPLNAIAVEMLSQNDNVSDPLRGDLG